MCGRIDMLALPLSCGSPVHVTSALCPVIWYLGMVVQE